MFVSYVKALIVLVSPSITSLSYAGFQKIIDIIIVDNNVSGPKLYSWGTNLFIGKVYHCTSSSLTDCLRLVEYYCVRCIAVSSIPVAPVYLTDPFALNNSVHDCHTCNSTNIPVRNYNLSSVQCKVAYNVGKLWDTIPECIQNAGSVDIFKTHILTVSHERCTHLQTFRDIYCLFVRTKNVIYILYTG